MKVTSSKAWLTSVEVLCEGYLEQGLAHCSVEVLCEGYLEQGLAHCSVEVLCDVTSSKAWLTVA